MEDIDKIYRELPLEQIPWHYDGPPEQLVELVEAGTVSPCRAVDLGCGAGSSSLWLAQRGFQVTGLDLSNAAIKQARARAEQAGVRCRFLAADLMSAPDELEGPFDFAFEWEVLHHVFPERRGAWIDTVHRLLPPGGRYLSLCFSDLDPWPGEGKYRKTRLGTVLYLSDENELRELFARRFRILQFQTIQVRGKLKPHTAHCALLEK